MGCVQQMHFLPSPLFTCLTCTCSLRRKKSGAVSTGNSLDPSSLFLHELFFPENSLYSLYTSVRAQNNSIIAFVTLGSKAIENKPYLLCSYPMFET